MHPVRRVVEIVQAVAIHAHVVQVRTTKTLPVGVPSGTAGIRYTFDCYDYILNDDCFSSGPVPMHHQSRIWRECQCRQSELWKCCLQVGCWSLVSSYKVML